MPSPRRISERSRSKLDGCSAHLTRKEASTDPYRTILGLIYSRLLPTYLCMHTYACTLTSVHPQEHAAAQHAPHSSIGVGKRLVTITTTIIKAP